ncbi:cation diffusion facilitator family transporter [Deminuibacter soli]|uniref:Cation transporter n=1 Tax=Deminuibacter soli TaxID=2291815 RepID=A0A3E1NCQ2_9BACT|nr:cation diffusion facilitator family transporter [Deminuibacter soli]RFM25789.1 cation transporter [Deminuibacter soli]
MPTSQKSVYSALAANVLIAVTKFVAGAFTNSSSMFAEGVHSLVDTINELLLLLGIHKSRQPPDELHPFGYGRELYFWSFIVSMLIFGLGGGISIYQGYLHIRHPQAIEDPSWNYVVLILSILFEGSSLVIAAKEFNKTRGEQSWWQAIKRSKDPSRFLVLFEDGAAVLGLLIVLVCQYLNQHLHLPVLDGVATTLVGVLLVFTSIILARESKSLLMGEGIGAGTRQKLIALTENEPAVNKVQKVFSMYLGPEEVLLILTVTFHNDLTTQQITATIEQLIAHIKKEYPVILHIVVYPVSRQMQ